jgi:hypothetical protein
VSYPQQGGYPQQPYNGGGYPTASTGGRTNPATAIIAALLALVVAGAEVYILVNLFDAIGDFSNVDAKGWAVIGTDAAAGLLLLLGTMFTLGRKMAGAVLIILGAILGIVGFFLYPVLAIGGSFIGQYLELVFKFASTDAIIQVVTLIGSPLALIFAIIPPTLNHLRGNRDDAYAASDPYPNSGGFQQQGYNNAPNSDPFPQQSSYPGSYPQQGGYPQQGQQGGGYPPQQQGW